MVAGSLQKDFDLPKVLIDAAGGCFESGSGSLSAWGELASDLFVVGRAGEFAGQFQFVVDEDFGRHGREAGVAQKDRQRRLTYSSLIFGDSVVSNHLLGP
jgi:hypothetical protein